MSKKKKKKYYQQASNPVATSPQFSATTGTTAPVMASSKPQSPANDKLTAVYNAHEQEYSTVRSDLIRVIIVNGVFLAAVLTLYYVNKSNPFLEAWYQKFF